MILIRENVLGLKEIQIYNDINFEELSHIPKINLRGQSDDKDFLGNVEKILNIILPIKPNTNNTNNELRVMWLSPNEWLVQINNKNKFKEIFLKLKSILNSQKSAVTDITENRTIIRISGLNLYKLLAKFMVIDLDKALKKEAAVAQTVFIKVPILIVRNHKEKERPSIDIHINRSHTNYIYNLLIDGTNNLDF